MDVLWLFISPFVYALELAGGIALSIAKLIWPVLIIIAVIMIIKIIRSAPKKKK